MRKNNWIILEFLVLIVLSGCSTSICAHSGLEKKDTFRIGTYNVENLFDVVDDPHKADDPAPPHEKLEALATVILTANCDILVLQEVENIEVLTDFNVYYLDGLYSHVVLVEGNDPRGIDVACLSKYPITNVVSYRDREIPDPTSDSTIRFSRDLLTIQWIDAKRRTWSLLTTHLKSGGCQHDSERRTLQANEIAKICRDESYISIFGHGLVILAGDLNAEPWTDDLEALSGVPFSDPARDLPYRFTHVSGKVLDYILLSPDADKRYKIGSYTIYRDPPSDDASDHYLVYLDLTL